MKKVAIAGYYGFDNAGDEAILAAIISSLRQCDSDLQITVLSANPARTAQIYGVQAVNRTSFAKIIETFRRVDLFLLGGGSLLQDVTSKKSIVYYLGLIYLAKKLGLPVMFYAQGVGPITSYLSKFLLPKVLNRVNRITVRDQKSKDLLLKSGIKKPVQVTADPVFNLPLPKEEELQQIIRKEGLDLNQKTIGVSVRYWQRNDDYLLTLAKVLEKINNKFEEISVCFLPLHYPVDLEASQKVCRRMEADVQILKGNYHPQQIAGLFKKIDLLVGVRLHSLIFAAINQVPMVGISYDPKVDNFLEQLNLQPAGKTSDLKETKLFDQILETWQKRKELKCKIQKGVTRLKELEKKNSELAWQLLHQQE